MKRYIKAGDLQAILSQSYEDKRRHTMEAIDRHEAAASAKLKRPIALVATFENAAVVADAEGGFHRYTLVRNGVCEDGTTWNGFPATISTREPYDGFRTMSEAEAGRDRNSMLERAANVLSSGQNGVSEILELMRDGT